MEAEDLITRLQQLKPGTKIKLAVFFGPGSPLAEVFDLDPHQFRETREGDFWLTVDIYDRSSKETLQRENRKG